MMLQKEKKMCRRKKELRGLECFYACCEQFYTRNIRRDEIVISFYMVITKAKCYIIRVRQQWLGHFVFGFLKSLS